VLIVILFLIFYISLSQTEYYKKYVEPSASEQSVQISANPSITTAPEDSSALEKYKVAYHIIKPHFLGLLTTYILAFLTSPVFWSSPVISA
jgi:hypothetical protein